MALRIRESIVKTWSSQTERQFGIDNPLRIKIESAAEETFLAMLELGIADGQLQTAAKLAGLELESAERILEQLRQIIEDFAPPLATSELQNLSFPIRESFRRRQQAVVLVPELDRLGKLLIHSLAHSGIGKIIVSDGTLINESDCGRLGYPRELIGNSKLSVIKSELANAPSKVKLDNRMGWADYTEVDIAVVPANGVFRPIDYQRWLSLGTTHIGICFSDKHVLVTGVIDEGSACLGCRELNKWDKDQSQKMIGSQIAGISGMRDSASVLFAASLTTQRIIQRIELGNHGTDTKFFFDGETKSLSEVTNPACGCQQSLGEI